MQDRQIPAGTDTLAHAITTISEGLALCAHDGVPPGMLQRQATVDAA